MARTSENVPAEGGASPPVQAAVRTQMRGSALLLAGRMLALALNLGTQVITVRYLSRDDYGLWAYAMALVAFLSTVNVLGLDKALARFAAIYREQMDYRRVFGALAIAVGAILLCAALLAGLFLGLHAQLPALLHADHAAIDLLVLLFVLAPLNALDSVAISFYSVFAGARTIFLRRHLMVPLLRLAAVLAVILLSGSVRALAITYAVSMAVGSLLNGLLLAHIMVRGGFWAQWQPRQLTLPHLELFGYSLPLLTTDLALLMYESLLVFLLEYFRSAGEVAAFQAVRPVAKLGDVVMLSFGVLFVPALSRLFARGDRAGLGQLHQQTALWVTTVSFPVFAVSFGLADTLAVLIFGQDYADAGRLLAWMSLGYFAAAATGLNLLTLKALGRVKLVVILDLSCAAVAAVSGFLLIPRFGATGAALTLLAALVLDGMLSCWLMARFAGVAPVAREHRAAYAAIGTGVLVLVLVRFVPGRTLVLDLAVTAVVIAGVWFTGRRSLRVRELFPELERIPLIKWMAR